MRMRHAHARHQQNRQQTTDNREQTATENRQRQHQHAAAAHASERPPSSFVQWNLRMHAPTQLPAAVLQLCMHSSSCAAATGSRSCRTCALAVSSAEQVPHRAVHYHAIPCPTSRQCVTHMQAGALLTTRQASRSWDGVCAGAAAVLHTERARAAASAAVVRHAKW